jgi:hypothetical protein
MGRCLELGTLVFGHMGKKSCALALEKIKDKAKRLKTINVLIGSLDAIVNDL